LNPTEIKKDVIKHQNFEVVGETVLYQGEELPPALITKVLSIVRDGLPLEHFEKFWQRLEKNPSSSSVNELIDFLSYKELPITEDGCFIAYRGVNSDYYSVNGNTNTKVLQGQVDDQGRILNAIGETIEVSRRQVDDNRDIGCSYGLHVGSLDYASSWGPKVIVVKVDPADVVSVPKDCSCQKCRVSKYEVLYDFVGEITASVVGDDGEDDVVTSDENERTEFVSKVDNYLQRKIEEGYEEVTVRQIQNSFSPVWPSKESVLDALQELWFDWDDNYVVDLNQ
jgi:23S rRNA U2552 (ribose-2'-O)-methylase RlmE/FtsJ